MQNEYFGSNLFMDNDLKAVVEGQKNTSDLSQQGKKRKKKKAREKIL